MSLLKVLIIPDVHGRTFWKDAINQFPYDIYPELEIIFLGDYLDPYSSYDGISKKDAYENFLEILEYSNKDNRVTLLIGNHDWHYFVNLDNCRIDNARSKDIEKLFKSNMHKFRLTKTIEINGTKYLFSHAGISKKCLDDIASMAKDEYDSWNPGDPDFNTYVDPDIDANYKWIEQFSNINNSHDFELFEKCLQNYDDSFYSGSISMISRDRGGWYAHGSLIWADVHEHLYSEDLDGYYQIFGHTITYPNGNPKEYSISPGGHNWAMLDASKAFILDDKRNILPIENGKS